MKVIIKKKNMYQREQQNQNLSMVFTVKSITVSRNFSSPLLSFLHWTREKMQVMMARINVSYWKLVEVWRNKQNKKDSKELHFSETSTSSIFQVTGERKVWGIEFCLSIALYQTRNTINNFWFMIIKRKV